MRVGGGVRRRYKERRGITRVEKEESFGDKAEKGFLIFVVFQNLGV